MDASSKNYRPISGILVRVTRHGEASLLETSAGDGVEYQSFALMLAKLAKEEWEDLCDLATGIPLQVTSYGGREFYAVPIPAPEDTAVEEALYFRIISTPYAVEVDEEMRDRLVNIQKMEAITVLAGGLSHDFNNILTSILGFAQLIRMDSNPDSPVMGYVSEIERAVDRSTALIRQMLTFARKVQGERMLLDMTPGLKEFCKVFRSSVGDNIEVIIDLAEDLPPVLLDSFMFHQAMSNVCLNSQEAIGDRRGRIQVTSRAVEVDAERVKNLVDCLPGTFICITVEDDGQGMDDETIGHIFEPFFTTKPVGEGTGLGLSTVFGIVKDHAGFLEVFSQVESGTCFRMFFPAEPVGEGENSRIDMQQYAGEGKVLIVDEDLDLLQMLSALLKNYGYHATTQSDGMEALELLSKNLNRFDAIMINHQLPGMMGRDLIPHVRRLRDDLPVVLMIGHGGGGSLKQASAFGADELLEKPILPENLIRTIFRLVKGKRGFVRD